MANRKRVTGLVIVGIVVAGGIYLVLPKRQVLPPPQSSSVDAGGDLLTNPIFSDKTASREEQLSKKEDSAVSFISSEQEECEDPSPIRNVAVETSVLLSTNELQRLLPEWMDYEGVDLRTETIFVAGCFVNRARGRFEWPNGSYMEMEVSDLGDAPDATLLKSLGFNIGAEPLAEELKIPLPDVEHTVMLQEYDLQTMEGCVQLLIRDRFLVEIQLENLPPESFGTVIDFQVPLKALMEATEKTSP